MATAAAAAPAEPGARDENNFWDRIGIPRPLVWGFVGVLLFMVGDGVESGFISPFLQDHGAGTEQRAGYIITAYGVGIAIASWLSGALSELIGPKRVMLIGLAFWAVMEVIFLAVAVPSQNYPLLLIVYGIRGVGYPFFAFGFLVWITATANARKLGTAVGWFYFAFTGGLPTLGALFASGAIPVFGGGERGEYRTFWASLVIIVIGGIVALVGVKERTGSQRLAPPEVKPLASLVHSVGVIRDHPRVGIGCIVRIINTMPEFGSLIFFPTFFATTVGYGTSRWLLLLSVIYGTNIFFNLIFGALSDKIGWRGTIFWFGAIGCAVSITLLYFVPLHFGEGRYWLSILVGMLYGATLAGFVPISALIPSLAPENKGGSLAMLNFGAGLAGLIGPLIASLFLPLGNGAVILIFAGFYVLAAVLTVFLKLPPESEEAIRAGRTLTQVAPEGQPAPA